MAAIVTCGRSSSLRMALCRTLWRKSLKKYSAISLYGPVMPIEPSKAPSTSPSDCKSPPAQKPRPAPVKITTLTIELRAISLHQRVEFQAHERIDGVELLGTIEGDDADARFAGVLGLSCTDHLRAL